MARREDCRARDQPSPPSSLPTSRMAVLLPTSFKGAWLYDKKSAPSGTVKEEDVDASYPCPRQFQVLFPSCDHYIAHNTFRKGKGFEPVVGPEYPGFPCRIFLSDIKIEEFVILLTDRKIYKFSTSISRIW